MKKAVIKKIACASLLTMAAVLSGCGSEHKVAVIDYQRLESESSKIKSIQDEIINKDKEIQNRLQQASQSGLSDAEMKKKVGDAGQERMIFIQSKQKQIESMIQSQAAAIAKEKNIGIVMQKRAVPSGSIDITDQVLEKIEGKTGAGAKSQSK